MSTTSNASDVQQNETKAVIPESSNVQVSAPRSSSGATSIAGSDSATEKSRKAPRKTKTSFHLAHPPPAIKRRQRLKMRPRLLLQLQQISDASRPVPAVDVIPSSHFAPKILRRCPFLKGRAGLGIDDLIVVNSQTYESSIESDVDVGDLSEDEKLENREIVAAICQLKKGEGKAGGEVEICVNHGPSWEASSLENGVYEFISVDDNGHRSTSRWVPKRPGGRRKGSISQGLPPTPSVLEKKYSFSVMTPGSRRHPIIASLSRTTLDILDQYETPSHPSTPLMMQGADSPTSIPITPGSALQYFSDDANSRTVLDTDEHLRTLIVVTGIWVAFREGWSEFFKYNDIKCLSATNSNNSHPKPRTTSMTSTDTYSTSLETTTSALENGKFRPSRLLTLHRSPTSTTSMPKANNTSPAPQRANSSGAAFLERANSRRVALKTDVQMISSPQKQKTRHGRARSSSILQSPISLPETEELRSSTPKSPQVGDESNQTFRQTGQAVSQSPERNHSSSPAPVTVPKEKAKRLNRIVEFITKTKKAFC
ncbi:hypothetical protein MMC20_006240 [Loxospora ochrophaea]|nr:hypothetical protein [Loxospora ochrophaea]